MKKGQAAMEFLMTYGWAILVVLVAIGALAYFGVLSPEKFLPEKCVISTGSGLFCGDFAATTSGVELQLQNILDKNVEITAATDIVVSFGDEECEIADAGLTFPIFIKADSNDMYDSDPLGPNEFTSIVLGDAVGTGSCAILQGDKIKGELIITFTPTGGLSKSTTGSIVTTAGP